VTPAAGSGQASGAPGDSVSESAALRPSASPSAAPAPADADGPTARGVFFFSPTCVPCQVVIDEQLPSIFESVGGEPSVAIDESLAPGELAFYLMGNEALQLLMVDISVDPGARMFVADSQRLGIGESDLPRLDIAGERLLGPTDIAERLPDLVAAALAGPGIDWPSVPGLAAALEPFPEAGTLPADGEAAGSPEVALPGASLSVWDRVMLDPLANGIAIALLVALLASLVAVPILAARGSLPDLPSWPVPWLALLGLAVSFYVGSVKSSGAELICGPVGDCNAVLRSDYASLTGVPNGVLGVVAYSLLLTGWIVAHLVRGRMADVILVGVAAGALAGTLLSAYLTFLEPFVIGATCLWCVTSALAVLGLLWLTAGPGWAGLRRLFGRQGLKIDTPA
jgi:uncharacterized membrane protein